MAANRAGAAAFLSSPYGAPSERDPQYIVLGLSEGRRSVWGLPAWCPTKERASEEQGRHGWVVDTATQSVRAQIFPRSQRARNAPLGRSGLSIEGGLDKARL